MMDIFKIFPLYLCIHAVCGSPIDIAQDGLTTANPEDSLRDKEITVEMVLPLISNNPIPDALMRNALTLFLLQIIRKIFRVTTQLGLAEFVWRLSSGFIATLITVIFGPNVNLILPVLTRIGNVILRWLT